MGEPRKPRVPLAAVVIGGLLAGGGLFGLFRVANAEPVPDPLPPVKLDEPRPDPFGALPVPSMPTAGEAVAPVAGIVPAPLPPVPSVPPKPDVTPLPKPADTLPIPKTVDPVPVTLPPLPDPKLVDPTPKPIEKPDAPLPTVPGIDPVLPKPTDLPQLPQPVKPIDPTTSVPPVKPEIGLRPEPPPLTVKPVPTPVGPETLPLPRKVGDEELPLPRPVVEQTTLPPVPTPGGGVPITTPTTPGLTPMPVSRTALLSALVGAAVSVAPAFADDPKPADPKALEAIQKQIDDLKADVTLLKNQKKTLEEQLFGRGDRKTATTDAEKGVLKRLEEADTARKEMAKKLDDLEKTLAQKSVSEKQPLSGLTPGKGLVKLVNEYNVKVSMMVNGTSYQLDVNQVKEIQVPEGELKYELVEFPNAVAKKTTIKEGETVTLRIK
jgi:hypothetical protein